MKFYTYYVALGYLKKRGFTRFETFDGKVVTIGQLMHSPIVSAPQDPAFIPHGDGTIRNSAGLIIIRPAKEA